MAQELGLSSVRTGSCGSDSFQDVGSGLKAAETTALMGIMLVYNLIRKEMLEVAEQAGVIPRRVSFRHSLQLIRVFCMAEAWIMSPGNLPKRLGGLCEMMGLLILPERRPKRRYKRHVKIKMSSYKRNPGKPIAKGSK